LIGASAAVVCLGGVLAACAGGGGRDGYVATGAAGGPPHPSPTAVTPTGDVTLVPLDGDREESRGAGAGNSPATGGGSRSIPETAAGAPGNPAPSDSGPESGRTATGSASSTATPGRTTPAGPAALSWSKPELEATDKRWCEDVTVAFRNFGGTAVRSGTVTFGTHVIGALGIDWATLDSTEKLPAPIGPGVREKKTWRVCVDAWRVPLGMHIETRDVSVQWK
jgi:hypothetical protein